MGGDYAPAEAINGVRMFFEQSHNPDVHLVLTGNAETVAPYMAALAPYAQRYTLVDAPQVIGMNEHPTKALKEKPDSSIAMGFGLLLKGKIDAFMSAGNTGAMLVGAMYSVKAIEGILRPAIASPIPRLDGGYNLLLDVGINADCKPEHLLQFAQLGSLYSKHVLGNESPRVALLNIGEEEGKGNLLAQATYPLLKELPGINFVGNVALKMAESFYDIFTQRGFKDDFLDTFNFETYGGTPILGINSPVIIGHGISHAPAFMNMIQVAEKLLSTGLTALFKENFRQSEKTPAN